MNEIIKQIFDSIDAPAIPAKKITLPHICPCIYVSEELILCYVGVWKRKDDSIRFPSLIPSYMKGKHSFQKQIKNELRGFLQLASGGIYLSNFIDEHYNAEEKFKLVPATIHFPRAAQIHYYVTAYGGWEPKQEFLDEIERQLFGLTYTELSTVLKAYGEIFQLQELYFTVPRITRMTTGGACCYLSDAWIPTSFPYLSFEAVDGPCSHISLYGFYQHLQLLIRNETYSLMANLLQKHGVSKTILERIIMLYAPFGIVINSSLKRYCSRYELHE